MEWTAAQRLLRRDGVGKSSGRPTRNRHLAWLVHARGWFGGNQHHAGRGTRRGARERTHDNGCPRAAVALDYVGRIRQWKGLGHSTHRWPPRSIHPGGRQRTLALLANNSRRRLVVLGFATGRNQQ